MSIGTWLRNLFRSEDREAEAVEREEYGRADRGEAELERDTAGGLGAASGLAGDEAADVAEADVGELKPPRDPAP